MNPSQMYDFILLSLCVWREARGEPLSTKQAVAWTIRNRVLNPGWWGSGWVGVILHPYQFSSFNANDPNATKLPLTSDLSWQDCQATAQGVYSPDPGTQPSLPDNSLGATFYYDKSLDNNPPAWSTDGSMIKTVDIGHLHFYKRA